MLAPRPQFLGQRASFISWPSVSDRVLHPDDLLLLLRHLSMGDSLASFILSLYSRGLDLQVRSYAVGQGGVCVCLSRRTGVDFKLGDS